MAAKRNTEKDHKTRYNNNVHFTCIHILAPKIKHCALLPYFAILFGANLKNLLQISVIS